MWEAATGVAAASRPGLFPQKSATALTALLFVALGIFLWPALGIFSLPAAALFSRLMALDLTTYTLPNIYTIPLFAVGVAYAALHGLLTQTLLACILLVCLAWFLGRSNMQAGMGGGDLKLLAALFAFFPASSAMLALGLGCVLWMPVAIAYPRHAVPFGMPILIGWAIFLRFGGLPNLVFSTIS